MGIQISVQVLQYFWIAWKKRCFSDYLIHPVADFDIDYKDLNIVDNKESLLYSIIVISMLGLGYEGSDRPLKAWEDSKTNGNENPFEHAQLDIMTHFLW